MRRLQLGHSIALIFAFLAAAVTLLACARELPEAGSPDAELYVKYCSGDGCHGAIPPKAYSAKLWDNQYTRMIELMKRADWALPTAEEEQRILDYLHRHADGADS